MCERSFQNEKLSHEQGGDARPPIEADVQYVLDPVWLQENDSATDSEAVLTTPVCDEVKYRDNEEVLNQFKRIRDEDRVPVCSTQCLSGQKVTRVEVKRLRDNAKCF
ncbi:hypothetical protein AB1Y20_012438 [Prymnesium parvum]|uniref:Uncharacterized protein n=1 Tax=Prymnesium parvum TaxID=97485 RepID=A0AB34ILA0_PRYPA